MTWLCDVVTLLVFQGLPDPMVDRVSRASPEAIRPRKDTQTVPCVSLASIQILLQLRAPARVLTVRGGNTPIWLVALIV